MQLVLAMLFACFLLLDITDIALMIRHDGCHRWKSRPGVKICGLYEYLRDAGWLTEVEGCGAMLLARGPFERMSKGQMEIVIKHLDGTPFQENGPRGLWT